MKKFFILIISITLGVVCLNTVANAADNSNPVTSNGNRLQYNVPYTLRDKNLPHRGGITFQAWNRYDYAIFAHSSVSNGAPIVFESPTNKIGFIDSEDFIIVRSTQSNWGGWHFWSFTSGFNANSVWLSDRRQGIGYLYGLSNDNSVGIGGLGIQALANAPMPVFIQLEGGHGSASWMTANIRFLPRWEMPPLNSRRTPFVISEL